ncbi:putative bifunctional diguanylate cyclase/phosphodiesterase [Blastococcus sp. SYSU D00669]
MHLPGRSTTRGRRRGAPLWVYLTALVLIPLAGVGVLTAVVAHARLAEADGAARAEEAVRTLARLDVARSHVEREVIPVLSVAVIDDPAAASALGLPPLLLEAQRHTAQSELVTFQAATDEALDAVPTDSVGAAAADRARADVAALRETAADRTIGLEQLYLGYLAVSNDLMNAERAAAAAAGSEGVPEHTLDAIRDVQASAQLAQSASRHLPLYLGSLFAPTDSVIGSRMGWQTAWLAYSDARRQMEDLSQPALRREWEEVMSSAAVTQVDEVLNGSRGAVSFMELIGLLYQADERSTSFTDLVSTATRSAQSLAAADRERANDRLWSTLQLGAGLLLAALLGAALLGRRVARSLGLLAGQARQISQGSLVDVEVAGPREVRTVSAALDAAVAGLRRIQDQAQAVARGDLDDALLHEPLPGPLGEVVHASVREIVASVRQREELQFALAHQATHDPLTQLPNRAQALTLVTSALHRARRSGAMTGLLFVDLDGFKAVNDGHGHACGDEVLQEVAVRLRGSVRPGDVVCRLGGDEFVVLVEDVPAERDLLELADRLIAAVSEPYAVAATSVRIGASVGVAVSRDGEVDADLLFAEADTAAYRAKDHGRGRAEIFDETLRRQLSDRAELEAAIAAALTNGQMRLHYQPVVDLASDRLMGYEALIRWERPGTGMVPPDEFIPVAESSQLICELDRWVLHEATRQLAEWRAAGTADGGPEPTIAVNVSGRHLADRRVVADVRDALDASGLPAELLVLEVTETVLVDDPVALAHLAALRGMGVAIALDDFGTGYTSIGQLRHMPVDTLKIDRSFISSTEPGHHDLVALIIRAAHTFGLTVVAEGVEEPAQLAALRAQDCDHAQGYLLHRPMPASDAGALLRQAAGAAS